MLVLREEELRLPGTPMTKDPALAPTACLLPGVRTAGAASRCRRGRGWKVGLFCVFVLSFPQFSSFCSSFFLSYVLLEREPPLLNAMWSREGPAFGVQVSGAATHQPPSIFPSPRIRLTGAGASGRGPGAAGSRSTGAFPGGRPQSHGNEGGRSRRAGAPGLSNSWTVCPAPSSHMARGCVAFTSTLVSHGDQREVTRGRESRPHSERGCFSQGPPTKADAAACSHRCSELA